MNVTLGGKMSKNKDIVYHKCSAQEAPCPPPKPDKPTGITLKKRHSQTVINDLIITNQLLKKENAKLKEQVAIKKSHKCYCNNDGYVCLCCYFEFSDKIKSLWDFISEDSDISIKDDSMKAEGIFCWKLKEEMLNRWPWLKEKK